MVTTDVDLIEIVGGGSCRCMLVEDWSAVTVDKRKNLKQRLNELEDSIKIEHELDDFFQSELGTDEDSQDAPCHQEDYWDR